MRRRLRFGIGGNLAGGEVVFGGEGAAFDDGFGDFAGEEANGAQCVVIAGDDPVDFIGIAIGIDDGDDGDAEAAGFLDGDGFFVRIDDEDHIGQAGHVFDTGEVGIELFALAFQTHDFLLGTSAVRTFGSHLLQFLEALDRLLHRGHIGEESAEPALVDVVHLAAGGFFGDGFLRLALGADEQHILALRGHFHYIAGCVLKELEGLLQIDNVDSVTFAKDVFFHLWIPALGLVPEVNAGFEQFFH